MTDILYHSSTKCNLTEWPELYTLLYCDTQASGGSLNLGGLLTSEGAKGALGSAGESDCNTLSSSGSDSSDNES